MSRGVALLLALLVFSVAANGYLLLTRKDAHEVKRTSAGAPPAHPQPPVVGSSPAAPETRSSNGASTTYAKLDRVTLEQRLATVEARLDELLPLPEKFKLGDPTPEHEEELRPMLVRVFGDDAKYELECRGKICHLTSQVTDDWTQTLQSDPDRGRFSSMTFGQDGVYMQLAEPEDAARAGLMRSIAEAFQTASKTSLADCKKSNPRPEGEMLATIKFEPAPRRLRVEVTGELASQAVGVCVRRAVEDLLEKIAIPPEAKAMEPLPITVRVP